MFRKCKRWYQKAHDLCVKDVTLSRNCVTLPGVKKTILGRKSELFIILFILK